MTEAPRGISLGRVTTLLLLGRAAGYVLALANSVIVARVLGVDRLGIYAYTLGVAGLFALLTNLGIGTVVTRAIARDPDVGGGMVRAAVRAQMLVAGCLVIGVPAFAAVLPAQPAPLGYIGLAAAQIAIGTLSWPYLAVLSGRARYDRVAAAELYAGVAGTACLLAAAALAGSVAAFLWAHLLAAVIAGVVARTLAVPFLPRGGAAPRLRDLLREAMPFGGVATVQSVYTRLDVLLLGQLASTRALGLYNVAYKPTNLAVYFGGTVAGALFPLMAQRATGSPVAFRRAVRGLGAAGPAMALALSGLAVPLLHALYGAEFTAAGPVLVLLAWSAAANWLYAPLGVALQARGEERGWLASLAGALVLNAAANLWAIPRWGALGAAGATLASEAALVLFSVLLVGRKLRTAPPLRPVCFAAGATTGGAAALWALAASGPMVSTLAALVVYGVLLRLFQLVTREDAVLVIGWMRQAVSGRSGG